MNERQLPQRLLLTGAAGGLGRVLRESLKPFTRQLRLSDIANLAPATSSQEEIQLCDLSDKAAVDALVALSKLPPGPFAPYSLAEYLRDYY